MTAVEQPINSSVLVEINKVLAISRATYLRAAESIDKGQLGNTTIFWPTEDPGAYGLFTVDPPRSLDGHLITQACFPHDDQEVVLHQDPW